MGRPARVGRPAVRVAVFEGGRPVLQNETVRDDSRLYGPPSLALQCELEVLRCVYTRGVGEEEGTEIFPAAELLRHTPIAPQAHNRRQD
eukprot:COSAG02_NODE_5984_length_3890_cov_11.855447_2_plen_89_part_00